MKIVGLCRSAALLLLWVACTLQLEAQEGSLSKIIQTQEILNVMTSERALGTIENIDSVKNTFQVGDKTFQYSNMDTMGPELDELAEGDEVKVMYDLNQDGTNTVTQVTKDE